MRAATELAQRPRVLLAALVSLGLLVSLNLAVRASGGDVHPLSLRRLPERALALSFLLAHRVHCSGSEEDFPAQQLVQDAAQRHGVSTRLALAVARTESDFVHTRISGTGAMGLMQLMPDTARELGVHDPFDARENADAGVRYLAQLVAMYRGDLRRAVAAYNAGMGRVPLSGPSSLPRETRSYVGRVLSSL